MYILYSYIVYLLVYNAAESQDANLGPKLERIDGSSDVSIVKLHSEENDQMDFWDNIGWIWLPFSMFFCIHVLEIHCTEGLGEILPGGTIL